MANDKTPELQTFKVIAKERAFYGGELVHPGQKLTVTARKMPKWAQPADQPLKVETRTAADLKPKAAQQAVKVKAAQASGNELA